MSDPADSAAAATTVAEATGLSPPAPEPTDSSAAASADTNKAAADILPGILIPANKPLALNNFLLHPRFYSMVANFVVYPFASGVCYAFGECWARVMMGRWGYLPAVVSKTSGKAVDSLQQGVMRELGYSDDAVEIVSASFDGIMLRSALFSTLTGGLFGYGLGARTAGSRQKRRKTSKTNNQLE